MDFLLLIVTISVILVCYFLWNKTNARESRRPIAQDSSIPGPDVKIGEEDAGHYPLISKAGGLVPFIRQLHQKYGAVCKFYLGRKMVVTVNDAELLKKTLKMGSRPTDLFKFITPLFGDDNIQVFEATRAKKVRQLLGPAYGHQVIVKKFSDLRDLALKTKDEMEQASVAKTPLLLQSCLLKFGLRAAVKAAISSDLDKIDFDKFKDCYDTVLGGLFDKQFGGLEEHKETEFQESLRFIRATYFSLIQKRQKERESNPNQSNDLDLCDIVLSSDDPMTGEPFAAEQRFMLLATSMMAAYHTSAVGICWTIFMLTQHPEVQIKVQQELDSLLNGRLPEHSGEKLMTGQNADCLEDLDKMQYTTQVVKESIRMFAPGPFAARLTDEDVHLGEFVIPKDSTLFYPLSAIMKNEKYWSNPDVFDPSRFEPQKEKKQIPLSYCPFGLGARICPGERLAWAEMRLMLAVLLQQFSFSLACKPEEVIPAERFVQMARDDIPVFLSPRSPK